MLSNFLTSVDFSHFLDCSFVSFSISLISSIRDLWNSWRSALVRISISISFVFILLWCKIVGIGCFYITSGSQVVIEKMSFYFEVVVVIDFF